MAEYLTEALDLSPDQITLEGRGPDDPVASNATADGKFMNRRVELRVENEQKFEWTFLDALEKQNSVTAPTTGLRPGENWPEEQAAVDRIEALMEEIRRKTAQKSNGQSTDASNGQRR